MQSIPKKSPGMRRPRLQLILLLLALLALLVILGVTSVLEDVSAPALPDPVDPSVMLLDYAPSDIHSITISRSGEASWTATQAVDGQLQLDGEGGYLLNETESADLLQSASRIIAADVLTDNPADYSDHLGDYGLADPEYEAWITFSDGREAHIRVGSASHDGTWRYMLLTGDDRLFAFSRGSVEGLFVNKDTLRKVTQPTLHRARIDQITLTGPEGVEAQWTLQADITASDAIDHWQISAPFTYPADSDAMSSLLSNIANLRLGAYVCEATPEALHKYGFDVPRLTIDVHMAEGTIGSVNSEGVYVTSDWPTSTLTFVIGGEKSDMVDYVRCGDQIYLSSRFTMGIFIGYDVQSTMSHYLLPVALGNLAALTIEENGSLTEYAISRTEQIAPNNELLYDDDGSVLYEATLTRNGEVADYAAFEAAYNALLTVTVSGLLPEPSAATPHTIWRFTDVDGTVHTLALATFDALHDAVIIDGHQAFYLIKGGFRLNMD